MIFYGIYIEDELSFLLFLEVLALLEPKHHIFLHILGDHLLFLLWSGFHLRLAPTLLIFIGHLSPGIHRLEPRIRDFLFLLHLDVVLDVVHPTFIVALHLFNGSEFLVGC